MTQRAPGLFTVSTTVLVTTFSLSLVATTWGASLRDDVPGDGRLTLTGRSRVHSPGLGGTSRAVEKPVSWDPKRTAAIVCDMWDLHHCLNAVRRETDMAPRMEEFLKALRARGVTIIHAPSSCMDAYKDHPGRLRAQNAPRSKNLPAGISSWCKQIPSEEKSAYPVDQTDGGEDDDPAEHAKWAARLAAMGRNPKAPWKTQTSLLSIDAEKDCISDDGEEIWSVLEDRGIDHVMLMGVHLNMCVLGRPFGLRQMARNGKDVVLVRDLTDTMYNPLKAPYVSHFTGTDRMVEHVERFVCPSISSEQVLGGKPFRYRTDTRPRLVFVIAEDEYKTETTLPPFAASHLGNHYKVSFVFDRADEKNDLPGLAQALDEADLAVISARRRVLPTDQVAALRRFVAAGKGIVGIRTASHAFAARGNAAIPPGHAVWPQFDADVLGGHYTNHHKEAGDVAVSIVPAAQKHPILTGIDPARLAGKGTLYKVSPLAVSTTPLLVGTIPGEPAEPLAWANLTSSGARVFYTSLGHAGDFEQEDFRRLLRNAIDWVADLKLSPEAESHETMSAIPFPK